MSSSVCMYFQSYRHSVDHFIFFVVSKLQSLFRQAALGGECSCFFKSVASSSNHCIFQLFSMYRQVGATAVQTVVFSNYFRCIVTCLCSCDARQVGAHCSSNHCIFEIVSIFSKQFTSLHFQRFYIAFSTILYFFAPSRLLQAAIFRCRCSCAVCQSPSTQFSGGMKVKVVLAAAMWQNPYVLMLDEPTNDLDCDGLGVRQ